MTRRSVLGLAIGSVWVAGVAFGFGRLLGYAGAAGKPADAPQTWPKGSHVRRARDVPTLIIAIHPRCPCSRATLGELEKLMTYCLGELDVTVVMLAPGGEPEGWGRTDLWRAAAAIPGVTVVPDRDGNESRRFGASTSGQALLYAPDGRLLFAGGITSSRGHAGDNAGAAAILSLVSARTAGPRGAPVAPPPTVPVYGCPLFSPPGPAPDGGGNPCHK